MRIGYLTNGTSCEYDMQDRMKQWLSEKELKYIDEFYVPEVQRRPDFLIFKGSHIINIEAKCNNLDEMLRQLKDNSKYCDYSFAFIPDYCMTSREFKRFLIQYGYGLIIYNHDKEIITEVLEAHYNNEIDKNLSRIVIQRMKLELINRKKKNEISTQEIINFN